MAKQSRYNFVAEHVARALQCDPALIQMELNHPAVKVNPREVSIAALSSQIAMRLSMPKVDDTIKNALIAAISAWNAEHPSASGYWKMV